MPRRAATTKTSGRIVLLLGLLVGGWLPLAAAPPNYFVRTWQVESGLPQNKVTSVVQARDGYLWLGTYKGLARFDGVHFTVFDDNNTPELRSSRVTRLFEAQDGALWIGDESGHVTRFKDDQFQAVPFQPVWSSGKIYDIAADEAGDVWLLNEAGELARTRDGRVLTPPAGVVAKVVGLAQAADGKIWIERAGRVSVLEHGLLRPIEFEGMTTNSYLQGIGARRAGGLWVASDGRLREWNGDRWGDDFGDAPWGLSIVTRMIETRSGVLFVGTADRGLFLIFPGHTQKPLQFGRTSHFPSDWVISLWEDREGNVWCGTGAGLVMVRPNNVETIAPPDQWQGRAVLSVYAGASGALWAGTEGAGLYRLQDGAWTNFNSDQGLRNPYIWSLAEDARGRMWAGTWGGGLFVQAGEAFHFAPGMEDLTPPMPALLSTPDALWVGTTAGLLRYQNGVATWFNQTNGQPLGDVRAIATDRRGVVWAGTAGNGLVCLEPGGIRQFKKADGLSSDFIECLRFASDGTLWIGTFGGGLNRLKAGRFAVINQQQGLPNSVIGDIETDARGFFWMSSYSGLIRVSEAELNRCADGAVPEVHCQIYGINDGLPTLECSEGLQPAGAQTADGRLWFSTSKGLIAVDPANVKTNLLPPPVIIESMRVDDRRFAAGHPSGRALQVRPGRHRFEFEYTALSFVVPEKVRFRYRLNGFDDGWRDAGAERTITYNYLLPGSYSFQVTACNNDGVWNESGARLAFVVLPFFWQTAWFRWLVLVVLIAASGGLAWFDTRRRMRRKLERAERQRDIERERTRIARDIHDDLGAQLTRITMISDAARGDLDNPGRAMIGLGRIYDTARELTRSMDEIVWAVNPRHDTLESLASYLEKFAQDLLATAGIRCRLDLPVQFPEWHLTSEVRHNVFLACKEALHNVIKHSAASEAGLRLAVGKQSFELVIEDNGRGFSTETARQQPVAIAGRAASGNGLENMNRRLAAIGGVCVIDSAPGKGARISFAVQITPP
jgi:signal transduction histidine kinase/ligand-binding sensor domain-containing protein